VGDEGIPIRSTVTLRAATLLRESPGQLPQWALWEAVNELKHVLSQPVVDTLLSEMALGSWDVQAEVADLADGRAAAPSPVHCYHDGSKFPSPFRGDDAVAFSGTTVDEGATDIGSEAEGQRLRRHSRHNARRSRDSRYPVAASSSSWEPPDTVSAPLLQDAHDTVFPPYIDPAEQEELAWCASRGQDEQIPWEDPEWDQLCTAVGAEAERLMEADKKLALPAALLKALWSMENSFSQRAVTKYQLQIADTLAAPTEDLSEADWWFLEALDEGCYLSQLGSA